jgi:glycosyltransferase involved in cell wall biosynthesis
VRKDEGIDNDISGGSSVLILVDNLRVGGIQRQVLDQMYLMSDLKIKSTLLVFDRVSTFKYSNFFKIESQLIENKNLKIVFSTSSLRDQITTIKSLIMKDEITLILDYTLSGSLKVRIAQLFSSHKIPVHCIVQQLASLSDSKQRYKRMFMAQFSTHLFANSVNYKKDWMQYISKNLFTKIFLAKKLSIVRNGIYLPRLNNSNFIDENFVQNEKIRVRFVFLGRLRAWKGLNNLSKIDQILEHKSSFLIITPEVEPQTVQLLEKKFGSRIEFMFGKTPTDYKPMRGDIHIYAVDYGDKFEIIESVSTNCLEMAYVGVPSLITKGGGENWPELRVNELIFEVDWNNEESIMSGLNSAINSYEAKRDWQQIIEAINVGESLRMHTEFLRARQGKKSSNIN